MGVALTELLIKKEINLDQLQNKILTVDTPLWLYQFLSSIRQRDGTLLTDSKGNTTSHLVGILSRVSNLISKNIKLAFVFDGTPPPLKLKTLEKRKEIKIEAQKKFKEAEDKGDIDAMKKFAQRTTRLTKEMIEESKLLIRSLGLPVIEAPSEAEAQASFIVKNKDAFSVATNDADALLFGATQIIRNLNMVGKRKKSSKLAYDIIQPELIVLKDNLKNLDITREQLIALSMLIGTDFNPSGIKGIGPKNAIKLVKKHKDLDELFKETKWDDFFESSWKEVFDTINNMPVNEDYELKWTSPNKEELTKLLVDKHEFSEQRINSQLNILAETKKKKSQKGLGDFL
tara:strand:- start:336 stop:1367 length:1032 start_codon:yes stop_codon:yes gene_type:complete